MTDNKYLVVRVRGGDMEGLTPGRTTSLGITRDPYEVKFTTRNFYRVPTGGNASTVAGTISYVGFSAVRAMLWERLDGTWFLGIDQAHLAELERAGEKFGRTSFHDLPVS